MFDGTTFNYEGMDVPSSKNLFHFSRKTGHKYPDKRVKAFYDWIIPQLEADREEFRKRMPKEGPVFLHIRFWRSTNRLFDLINPTQTVQDAMVKAGLIEDDNYKMLWPLFEKVMVDKNRPGFTMWIGHETH